MDEISAILKAAKEYGVGVDGVIWIMIFVLIASISGRGAKAAILFVRGLLETSSELRGQIQTQLDSANLRLSLLQNEVMQEQAINRRLKDELQTSSAKMRTLMEELGSAESRISTLMMTIDIRDKQLDELRDQIGLAKEIMKK